MRFLTKSLGKAGMGFMALIMLVASATAKNDAPTAAIVTVVHAPAWSEGDAAREGAAEMMVMLEIARLRQCGKGGLIAVGDRRGLFNAGAEEALRLAVLQGVPVVKLAGKGRVLQAPHGLFLDGGILSEDEARSLLAHCIETYGALPVVAVKNSASVPNELRTRLQLFQKEFTLAAGLRVATR